MNTINYYMSQLHFLRPEWFWALVPLALLLMFMVKTMRNSNQWQQVCDKHLLPHLLVATQQRRQYLPLIILALAWLISVTALAGPTWQKKALSVYESNTANVIVLDMSQAMNAKDIKPSRLQRAKFKIIDLLNHIDDGLVGMIAFTSEPFVVTPITRDASVIAKLVPALNSHIMPTFGVNIAVALQKAAQLIKQSGGKHGNIILLTANTPTQAALQIAKKIEKQGDRISVLGMGTTEGAPVPMRQGGFVTNDHGDVVVSRLDPKALATLAEEGNGIYINFTETDRDVNKLADFVNHDFVEQNQKTKDKLELWVDDGHWLILPLLLIVLLSFRSGWLENVS